MAENTTSLGKEMAIEIQVAQKIPKVMSPKKSTLRHIIIKLSKVQGKEGVKKNKRKVTCHVQRNPFKTVSGISAETLHSRRERYNIFRVLKEKEKTTPLIKDTTLRMKWFFRNGGRVSQKNKN